VRTSDVRTCPETRAGSCVSGPAIRAATDVGGTFTDLVYFTTDPAFPAES
jgi:N-methylhydantoinase A/oxoprolinase/acetone carboxylase beta subunit